MEHKVSRTNSVVHSQFVFGSRLMDTTMFVSHGMCINPFVRSRAEKATRCSYILWYPFDEEEKFVRSRFSMQVKYM